MLFLKLPVFRAVEFFIRDKYEKKKYYDKNAIAITNVSKIFISIANSCLLSRSGTFNIRYSSVYLLRKCASYILEKFEHWKFLSHNVTELSQSRTLDSERSIFYARV